MAKQPSGSSGGGMDAGGGRSDPAQSVRQTAENTLSQARQAVDQYMREATRLYGAVEASAEAAQSGTREINRKAIGFAETKATRPSTSRSASSAPRTPRKSSGFSRNS